MRTIQVRKRVDEYFYARSATARTANSSHIRLKSQEDSKADSFFQQSDHGRVVLVIVAVTMATNYSESFDDIKARQALAATLNCDVEALEYAVIKTSQVLCRRNGCP